MEHSAKYSEILMRIEMVHLSGLTFYYYCHCLNLIMIKGLESVALL